MLTFCDKNCIFFKISEKNDLKQELLEVSVEPRSAAVEHLAAPVEPVLAPVDKGSSP